MQILITIRRIVEALVTATAVVFGLTPDPSLVPVERDVPAVDRNWKAVN